MTDKLNKTEINRRLKEIENGIDKLKREKQQLLKMRQDIKHREQSEKPNIHLLIKQQKYIVANCRVADRVYSIYIGDKKLWGGDSWEKNKKLMDYATKTMKLKLKEKVKL